MMLLWANIFKQLQCDIALNNYEDDVSLGRRRFRPTIFKIHAHLQKVNFQKYQKFTSTYFDS